MTAISSLENIYSEVPFTECPLQATQFTPDSQEFHSICNLYLDFRSDSGTREMGCCFEAQVDTLSAWTCNVASRLKYRRLASTACAVRVGGRMTYSARLELDSGGACLPLASSGGAQ